MMELTLAKQMPDKVKVNNLNFYYGNAHILKNINLGVLENQVTALIGPSGCGKTTLLRCFNRMHDLYPNNRYEGEIYLNSLSDNMISPKVDPITVRLRVSMVFQKPNPFPKSIYENIAYALRVRGRMPDRILKEKVEQALKRAALWEEVKDRLKKPAYSLSGGQQQRLCIARALVTEPELLLLDEPTSALDPIATDRIEHLLKDLKKDVTILIVTHSLHQAGRLSDYTAFMYLGRMWEFDKTEVLFSKPVQPETKDYLSGRIG